MKAKRMVLIQACNRPRRYMKPRRVERTTLLQSIQKRLLRLYLYNRCTRAVHSCHRGEDDKSSAGAGTA